MHALNATTKEPRTSSSVKNEARELFEVDLHYLRTACSLLSYRIDDRDNDTFAELELLVSSLPQPQARCSQKCTVPPGWLPSCLKLLRDQAGALGAQLASQLQLSSMPCLAH